MNTKDVRAQMLELLRRRDRLETKLQEVEKRIAFLQASSGAVGRRAFDDHTRARFTVLEQHLKRVLLKRPLTTSELGLADENVEGEAL